MGSGSSKEQLVTTAIENQDVNELRTALKDMTPTQIRALCQSLVPNDENQYTILHYAAWQDNPEILAPLLEYADDLETRDALGWTPLMTAVNRGSKQNVELLLARGAKIDCDWSKGISLIADAMNFNDIDLITTLMDRGALVVPTAEMLANGQDQSSFFLLHYAVDDGLYDIAKLLIERGKVPVNTLDKSGWSPLHLAAGHNNVELTKLLISNGADVNIKDSHGNTPLAWAKEMNAADTIQELAKHGAVADKDWHGEKLEMKTNEEREQEELYHLDDHDFEANADADLGKTTQSSRFEIEVEDAKAKRQNSINNKDPITLDALQRQRTPGKTAV